MSEAPRILFYGDVIDTVIEWCGVEGIRHLMMLKDFFPEAELIIISKRTKRSDDDPIQFYPQVDTPVDDPTFRDQRARYEIKLATIGSSLRNRAVPSRSDNSVRIAHKSSLDT